MPPIATCPRDGQNAHLRGHRAYIRRLRWPTGFCCPDCGVVGEPWEMAVAGCGAGHAAGSTSITAGTIFEGTRKPLRDMVPGDLVRRPAERTGWRAPGCRARPRPRQLRDLLDLAAQAAAGHGAGPAATTLPARSRPTKPMWAARKKASGAVRSSVRPSSRWRLNSAGAASGASAFGASRTSPPRACWPSCKKPWSWGDNSTPTAGEATPGCRPPVYLPSGHGDPAAARNRRTRSCRASTRSPPCSKFRCVG